MRTLVQALVWAGGALVCASSGAVIPANPRAIAGFDHIRPQQVGSVLAAFCKRNGCAAQFLGEDHGNYGWNLNVGDTRPVLVGTGCAGISHRYCVQTWGADGKTFMTLKRTQQLKRMLEAKGAKVVLMDCSFGPTKHGNDYVCTNGKPPP